MSYPSLLSHKFIVVGCIPDKRANLVFDIPVISRKEFTFSLSVILSPPFNFYNNVIIKKRIKIYPALYRPSKFLLTLRQDIFSDKGLALV